ncbi:MAG: hypothetical protein JZU52_09215 [Lamprocystis purpurea]|nr:hypothetical protein [Lamprocystis purpurea]
MAELGGRVGGGGEGLVEAMNIEHDLLAPGAFQPTLDSLGQLALGRSVTGEPVAIPLDQAARQPMQLVGLVRERSQLLDLAERQLDFPCQFTGDDSVSSCFRT